MPILDRDKVMMVQREKAAILAHRALDRIQSELPEEQVSGVAVLFATIAHRCGFDPQELHALGMKILRDEKFHHKGNIQIESLRDFAGLRLRDGVGLN